MAIKVKETKDNIKAKILKEDCPIKCACIKETDTSIKANIQTNLTNATTTNKGIVRLATLEEAITGTDNTTAITPYTLHNVSTYTAGDGINITNKVISVNDDIIATKEFVNEEINLLDNQISLINNTINTYGDIVTYNATDFATKNQGLLADSALQPNDNISELVNNVGYITGITSSDIQTALGYIPYSAENPSGFITISALNGYATENWVGQQGYLTSSDLSGYATEQWVNNQGFIKGISNTDVINALGYTPYNSSNPSGFITNVVNDLANYYLKTETYTKTEVQQLIASIPQFSVVVVQTLPVTGERMILYLVPKEGASPDVYNEYIWIEADEDYELIGNTAIDLTNYVQFTDLATVATTGVYDDLIDKPIPPIGYGTSSTAGGTATKVVSIPEITELSVGQVIVVKPSVTSSVANSKIKLNDFEAYNMRYNNANITTSTDSIVWTANVASMFIFDGTYWQFLGHGLDINTNTTYASMSVNEGITGTATATRSLTATNLKQIIQGTKLKGLVTTDDADVVASDSITIGIGKLQAQSTKTKSILEDKQNTLNAGTNLEIIRHPVGETTIDGTDSITLGGAKANSLNSVTLYGACSQSSAPTPENPVDITCNNGVIGWDSANNVITVTGTTETVTDSLNNTATAEMLLAIGDFKDEQELLSGNVTHKFKVFVLNGTETWTKTTSAGQFYNTVSDIEQSITGTNTCLCTHFVQAENNTQTEGLTGLFSVRLNHNGFLFSWDSSKTVAQWQAWLAEQYSNGTPVIVIYPLETPTTETVTAQTLNTQSGNNTLTITQASLNNLALSANYEAVGDVINFTGTIGNGTITINQGGTPKGTFTTNQNGNTTIDLDAGSTVDQTFDGTSTNAQSGVAIKNAKFIQNTATASGSLTILGTSNRLFGSSINIGESSSIGAQQSVAIGYLSDAYSTKSIALGTRSGSDGDYSIAIGYQAYTYMANSAIQLGYGENSIANSLNIGFYNNDTTHYNWQLLDGTTGLIPDERISSNIARTSSIGNGTITFTQGGVTKGTITTNQSGDTTIDFDAGGGGGAVDSVNGQTGVVVLTASDVGALADTTTIPSKTSDLTNDSGFITVSALNGYATETWVNNQGFLISSDLAPYVTSTNLTTILADYALTADVPTKTSELTNDSNFATISQIPTVGNGTVTINQGGTQKGTFTLNQSGNATINLDAGGGTPSNMMTTDTAQDVSGRKTFLGEKAIYFKQQTTSNKLGFTLYNPSNTELGALEYRPSTIGSASLLALNCPQTTGGYVGFRYWGTPAVNIVAPKVATAGNYYIPINFTNGTNTVTSNNVGTVNISTLIPTIATSVSSSSTNAQTVGAKLFYDTVGNIETLLSYV